MVFRRMILGTEKPGLEKGRFFEISEEISFETPAALYDTESRALADK